MPRVKVVGFDHVVVNSTDIERSLAFYCDELGLEPVRVDDWRRGDVLFPSARVNAETIIDLFPSERSGENVNHFCLVVERLDLDAIAGAVSGRPPRRRTVRRAGLRVERLRALIPTATRSS